VFSQHTDWELTDKSDTERVVLTYFELIRDLRAGDEEAVSKLLSLWDQDGTFEFCGSQPVTGTFKGVAAIHTLYRNRVKANGMPLKLEGKKGRAEASAESALGVVNTEISRMKVMDEKVVAGWRTVIGTEDGRGFQVAGSHTFTFKDGKISSLKIVISPRADEVSNLQLEDLSVNDIGRLALAAWPVV
jgi:ketosteroid isomerase-like protein